MKRATDGIMPAVALDESAYPGHAWGSDSVRRTRYSLDFTVQGVRGGIFR